MGEYNASGSFPFGFAQGQDDGKTNTADRFVADLFVADLLIADLG